MPIDFRSQRQATFEQGTTDPTWGFDNAPSSWFFTVTGNTSFPQDLGYGERDLTTATSQKYIRASTYSSVSTKPHGTIDVNWKNKDEVWYGAAFFLPSNFQTNHGNIEILRWDSSTGDDFGGIGLRSSDHKFHLVGGTNSGLGDDIGNASFNLPTGRWVWLEIHQKFGDSGDSPLNEVFVDGRLISTSTSANRFSQTPNDDVVDAFGVGYVTDDPGLSPISTMYIDRVSVLGGQRGAFRGTADPDPVPDPVPAPETPTGLTASANQTSVVIWANEVTPTPTGYAFQRRVPGGAWGERGTVPSTGFLDTAADVQHRLRVQDHGLQGGHRDPRGERPLQSDRGEDVGVLTRH